MLVTIAIGFMIYRLGKQTTCDSILSYKHNTTTMQTINFWPILVSTIVAFGLSALWYSPILFGREWMSLTQTTNADIDRAKTSGIWRLYAVQFVATFVSFLLLAFIISATASTGGSNGAFFGFAVWVGFVATTTIGGMLWEKRTFKLTLIDTVITLINLVIGGAIIGAW